MSKEHWDISTSPTRGRPRSASERLRVLLVVMGPGLVVMAADNDAGSVSTFAQAGQNYGLRWTWVILLLAVALYVVQEMVGRLGAVTGAGHARLIFERFGPLWGGFALGDLLLLNVLLLVTEFIGLQFGLGYFGVNRFIAVPFGGLALIGVTATGSFRRWERAMFVLVAISFVIAPLLIVAHLHNGHQAPIGVREPSMAGFPMLFGLALVGTTVAPWQLFFQQSSVVDKRIATRWIPYERAETGTGVVLFALGAIAIIAACAEAFGRTALHGSFVDAGAVANGLRATTGPWGGRVVRDGPDRRVDSRGGRRDTGHRVRGGRLHRGAPLPAPGME